jgi:hypothetical protein
MVYIGVSLIRYINNNWTNPDYDPFLVFVIIAMLIVAIFWTFMTLIVDLYNTLAFNS